MKFKNLRLLDKQQFQFMKHSTWQEYGVHSIQRWHRTQFICIVHACVFVFSFVFETTSNIICIVCCVLLSTSASPSSSSAASAAASAASFFKMTTVWKITWNKLENEIATATAAPPPMAMTNQISRCQVVRGKLNWIDRIRKAEKKRRDSFFVVEKAGIHQRVYLLVRWAHDGLMIKMLSFRVLVTSLSEVFTIYA